MAKHKQLKKAKINKEKPLNPFDMHVNRQKTKVLGQKCKNDRGLPGISRSKAIQKRKNTLLPEYKLKDKTNRFLDQRIGEKNKNLMEEDKILARFTRERIKLHKKKSIFNLGDDEILTHRGQTLNEIQQFDEDPRSDDEFDEAEGQLKDYFVSDAHFGGGLLENTGKEGAKSRKDLIDELIYESKKRKMEKQKEKEATMELTEKLDNEWKDLMPFINSKTKEDEMKMIAKDDYDKVVNELKFESRGQPTDRLKSEVEVAKEEKERLEVLEKERLIRMKADIDLNTKVIKHKSADDLDDDFLIVDDDDDDDNQSDEDENNDDDEKVNDNDDESNCDESSSETEDNLSDLKSDDDLSDDDKSTNDKCWKVDPKVDDCLSGKTDKNDEDDMNKSDCQNKNDSSDDDDICESNLFISNNNEEDKSDGDIKKVNVSDKDKNNKRKQLLINENNKKIKLENDKNNRNDDLNVMIDNNKQFNLEKDRLIQYNIDKKERMGSNDRNDLVEFNIENENRNQIEVRGGNNKKGENQLEIDVSNDRLPFVFDIPETYEEFSRILCERCLDDQSVIVERMIKCNHAQLNVNNKIKLETLFIYLLQYLNDVANHLNFKKNRMKRNEWNGKHCFNVLDKLVKHIYVLCEMTKPEFVKRTFESVLKEKFEEYKVNPKVFCPLSTLIYFKLISLLFSTSDYRHCIVTPAIIFINDMLTNVKIHTRQHISIGLYLVTIVLEYTNISKRFLPSVINFLRGVIFLSIEKTRIRQLRTTPTFKQNQSLLVLREHMSNLTFDKYSRMLSDDLTNQLTDVSDEFRVRAIYTTLKLLNEFLDNYKCLASCYEIFDSVYGLLVLLTEKSEMYPKEFVFELDLLRDRIEIERNTHAYYYLEGLKTKPKFLKMYEPNIQKVFDNKRHRNLPKDLAEKQKLIYKLKKETKGAQREIKKDNQFLRNIVVNKKIKSDKERREKVKEIYSSASVQQSELNAYERKKKKKTF